MDAQTKAFPLKQGDQQSGTEDNEEATSNLIPSPQNLPKYFPKDHELTKWLINQMRNRNGLHHLINLANMHPYIMSSHFETLDQPEKYTTLKEGYTSCAYSNKTVLFLTPLAIAIFLGYRSVIQLLLDESGSRMQLRARRNVDVNAICYGRRTRPKLGVYGADDYFTTTPAFLAIRREYFEGLSLLMSSNFAPQERMFFVEHVATPEQTTHWLTDAMDYGVRLLISRPGFDIVSLFHAITYRHPNGSCYFDSMAYDVYTYRKESHQEDTWFSLFRRLCRKGVNPSYINCANRIINLLEILEAGGFFRQEYMCRGTVDYNVNSYRSRIRKQQPSTRMTSAKIRNFSSETMQIVSKAIAVDRDECLALLTVWLNRMRNRCMEKQAQKLTKLLLSTLKDTKMLDNFLFSPTEINTRETLWPPWLELANSISQQINTNWKCCTEEINIFSEDAFDTYPLEPVQVHELRMELTNMALATGSIQKKQPANFSKKESTHRNKLNAETDEPPVKYRSETKKTSSKPSKNVSPPTVALIEQAWEISIEKSSEQCSPFPLSHGDTVRITPPVKLKINTPKTKPPTVTRVPIRRRTRSDKASEPWSRGMRTSSASRQRRNGSQLPKK